MTIIIIALNKIFKLTYRVSQFHTKSHSGIIMRTYLHIALYIAGKNYSVESCVIWLKQNSSFNLISKCLSFNSVC